MADDGLLEKVHDLSDLELAVLLSLISREHCLISTPDDTLEDLVEELRLIARKTFGLTFVVVDCRPTTTLEDFAAALLPPKSTSTGRSISPLQTRGEPGYFASKSFSHSQSHPRAAGISPLTAYSSSQVANCVFAKNLDRAPQAVQIQALELLRTRRIFTRTAVQTAPKQFLFVPVLSAARAGDGHVTKHLNDFFFIGHWHGPDDGFVNLEEADGGDVAETASTESVVKKGQHVEDLPEASLISESEISQLAKLSKQVKVDVDVVRYQMNVVSFLRMHRAVAEGITPAATKHLDQLVRCLAPIHGTDFVTPALTGLAARKVYLHRIRVALPEQERSTQWGSKPDAVKALLEDVGPDEIIEDVLEMVIAPV